MKVLVKFRPDFSAELVDVLWSADLDTVKQAAQSEGGKKFLVITFVRPDGTHDEDMSRLANVADLIVNDTLKPLSELL